MGLTFTLTDNEIPPSPIFIEFLNSFFKDEPYHVGQWYLQEEEGLSNNDQRFNDIRDKVKYVMSLEQGTQALLRSYRLFKEMLTGRPDNLKTISRFRFFFIIGIPRTGGTYLTKQIFRACNIDYNKVQNALAHDGFPHLAHLSFQGESNIHTNSLLQLAEYLTMVELYYMKYGKLAFQGGVVVPKKFTKSVYNFSIIKELFGSNSNYIITLRHPLTMIQSILDKSGNMPDNNKFQSRSAIEKWALDNMVNNGFKEQEVIGKMDYVDVLLNYWQNYHYQMALAGIPNMPTTDIVTFGVKSMTEYVSKLYDNFGVNIKPESFKTPSKTTFATVEHKKKADKIIANVNNLWSSLGMKFPADKLEI